MKRRTVGDAMTSPVVSVLGSASYHAIVEVMVSKGISAVPVVDAEGRVVGVVSEADLLHKLEFAGVGPARGLLERRRSRDGRAKAGAVLAADLMSAPPVTVRPSASVGAAATLMSERHVKRLPVVDGAGTLVGIISRCDLLRLYARPDDELLSEIRDQVLLRTLWMDPDSLSVTVRQGVVTLAGATDRRSTIHLLEQLVQTVPGVTDVVSHLSYHLDDRPAHLSAASMS